MRSDATLAGLWRLGMVSLGSSFLATQGLIATIPSGLETRFPIPALLDLFRDNFDDGITIRSSEQFRFFFLRQCEKYTSTCHSIFTSNDQDHRPPLETGTGCESSVQRALSIGTEKNAIRRYNRVPLCTTSNMTMTARIEIG